MVLLFGHFILQLYRKITKGERDGRDAENRRDNELEIRCGAGLFTFFHNPIAFS
jgi:hypothetical protein